MTMSIVRYYQKIISFANQNQLFIHNFQVGRNKKYIQNTFYGVLITCLLLSLSSCGGSFQAPAESPTRGNITITSDESFQPLIDAEVFSFTHLYTNAAIKAQYKPEYDVINDFMNDSVKVIVTSKKLSDDQIEYLREGLVIARTVTFAYDALALVVNKANKDTLLKYEDIRDIFLGKKKTWKELDSGSDLGDIRVIFDNTKSANVRYFKELFEIEGSLPDNFFAVNNNEEVISFVERNHDALGIISVNWISDQDDPKARNLAEQITITGISRPFFNDNSYYRPDQGWIYDRSYPFVREVYFISRETFTGLGSGFIQWATAEQGQRIVLKSGLVPATMPVRLVQIRN